MLAKFHVREYWESDDSRKAGEAYFYRKMNSCAHFLCWFVYIPAINLSLSPVFFQALNRVILIRNLFKNMGNSTQTDKLTVQTVFETREDLTKIGKLFHHSRQWATNNVKTILLSHFIHLFPV